MRIWLGMLEVDMLVVMLMLLCVRALLFVSCDCWAADALVGTRAAAEKYVRGHAGRGSEPAGGHGRPGCPGGASFYSEWQ